MAEKFCLSDKRFWLEYGSKGQPRYFEKDVRRAVQMLLDWSDEQMKYNLIFGKSSDEINHEWVDKICEVFGERFI